MSLSQKRSEVYIPDPQPNKWPQPPATLGLLHQTSSELSPTIPELQDSNGSNHDVADNEIRNAARRYHRWNFIPAQNCSTFNVANLIIQGLTLAENP